MGNWVAERVDHAQPATAPGRLVAVRSGDGWYPAMLPGHAVQRCRGTLAKLTLSPGDLTLLDRYEGSEYRRVALRVRGEDGRLACAMTYLWRATMEPSALAVPDGNFLGWLARTRRRAFATLRNGA
jgi:hypothetical protein